MAKIPTKNQPGATVLTTVDPQPFQENLRKDAFGVDVAQAIGQFADEGARIAEEHLEDDSRRKAKDFENQYREAIRKLEFGDGQTDGDFGMAKKNG